MYVSPTLAAKFTLTSDCKGIEGEIKLSGSTPELDDFTLRIVDGMITMRFELCLQ